MKLKRLFLEAKYDLHRSNIKTWFDECMSKYFPEYSNKLGSEWEYPKFEIKSHASRAGWFLCSFDRKTGKPVNPIITINPDFLEYTAKNITYHETIHYVQANVYGYNRYSTMKNGGHDSFFEQAMSKINSGEGADFVTVKQETQSLANQKTSKEFWVYGVKTSKGEFAFGYSPTRRENVRDYLLKQKKANLYKQVYEFQSDQFKYKIGGITKTSMKFAVPNDQPTDQEMSQYAIS